MSNKNLHFTIEDLALLAGLENPYKYGLKVIAERLNHTAEYPSSSVYKNIYRRTGRTTQAILKAISYMLQGEDALIINKTFEQNLEGMKIYQSIVINLEENHPEIVAKLSEREIRFITDGHPGELRGLTNYIFIEDK